LNISITAFNNPDSTVQVTKLWITLECKSSKRSTHKLLRGISLSTARKTSEAGRP